jgi:hypothetical protein
MHNAIDDTTYDATDIDDTTDIGNL